jgi:predicted aminopeptidase
MIAAAVSLALLSGGCGNVGYYLQSAGGQFEILRLARPVPEVMADSATAPELRVRLRVAQEAREFASRDLGLPDNRSYRSYADLGRPFVVWNVFATGELSTRLEEWCFPVAGCVSYRGYFAKADADAYGEELRARGYDVFVSGVPAYSTLGWFDDPLLSTFLRYPDAEVVRIIFHELAHQVVYVPDDTVFNESFATAVEMEGMRRWLERTGYRDQQSAYGGMQERKRQFMALVLKYRSRLEEIYSSSSPDGDKRAGKRRILQELRAEYGALKAEWGGYPGYDRWFAQDLGNAQLASVAAYTERVPAFQALLAREGGDLARFYQSVAQMARLPKTERDARLAELAADSPSPAAAAPAVSRNSGS